MSPRSILKHPQLSDLSHNPLYGPEPFPFAACPTVQLSPHVHFPPTPTLTSTFVTHSPSAYDRTPAEVLPNSCALPGRHEREFIDMTYSHSHSHYRSSLWEIDALKDSYFHPRAWEASSREPSSSESDDSDSLRTPPPELAYTHHTPSISVHYASRNTSHHAMMPYSFTQDDIESALSLSFLPHPHASSSPAKDKKGVRRSQSHSHRHHHHRPSREKSADGRIRDQSEFRVPSLDFDGCLGGF